MERIPIKKNPRLFDRVIQEMQIGLANYLPWLTHSFGKAERLVKDILGKKYYTPNIYVGRNEYELIAPDSTLGNFSFFVLNEPQDVEYEVGARNELKAPFSLIVWLDLRTIEDEDERNTEAVKRQILRALNGEIKLRNGRAKINRIYERDENVFSGFTLNEIDNQYLMHPFVAFRFEGVMQVTEECL